MGPRWIVAAGVAGSLLTMVPFGTAGAASSSLSPTTVVRLRPVTGHGQLRTGYSVTKRFSHGSCQAGSEATGDAYRCFAGKANSNLRHVIDPCWAAGAAGFAYCLREPWSFNVVQIHVTKGFSGTPGRRTPKLPWGVQVSDGQQCVLAQGAGGVISGKRINYYCGNANYVLYGNVKKRHPVWRIHKAMKSGGTYAPTGRAALTKAWFGKRSHQA